MTRKLSIIVIALLEANPNINIVFRTRVGLICVYVCQFVCDMSRQVSFILGGKIQNSKPIRVLVKLI